MGELIMGILVGAVSLALFAYWFRYTCILILSTKTSQDYSYEIAHANELSFPQIRTAVTAANGQGLEVLRSGLDHDYRVVSSLLRNTTARDRETESLEEAILRINFSGLKLFYRMAKPVSAGLARAALIEMSEVVAHFANTVGERCTVSAAS